MRTLWLALAAAAAALAYDPAVTTAGSLRLEILDPGRVDALETPLPLTVRLRAVGQDAVRGTLRVVVLEPWRFDGPDRAAVDLAAGAEQDLSFRVIPGRGTYRGHYPVHAYMDLAGGEQVHAVLVVETRPPLTPPPADAVVRVPTEGAVQLARRRPTRVLVTQFDGPAIALPGGAAEEPTTRAHFASAGAVTRGDTRDAIGFHPPWLDGRKGLIIGEYRVALPRTVPLTFGAGVAIRDIGATEPPSDGVTFRVEVSADAGEPTVLVSEHSASKVWHEINGDLSPFAGRTVTLRLVGDPGPARDTTCDGAWWGAPQIRAGAEPPREPAEAREQRARQAARKAAAMLDGNVSSAAWRVDGAAGPAAYALVPGPLGLLDAQLACATAAGVVVHDGWRIDIDGAPLGELLAGEEPTTVAATERRPDAPVVATHRFAAADGLHTAQARIEPTAQGLRVAWTIPDAVRTPRGEPWITSLRLGPASVAPARVYFGHGHVLVGSPRFHVGYGGFSLSTRYAGVDYANGVALVTGCEPFPTGLSHDAALRLTGLIASGDTTFDLIATDRGAFAGARAWRLLAERPASPGVAAIRGKMCLDQWGGDYAEAAEGLRLATAYGLDEAVFVKHAWQRWGYDYRLPDIWPPQGSLDDFRAMAAAAQLNGRLFAPHDNYIDFYPDADGFSYDHIQFQADGQPLPAWLNEGRGARSYRWSPVAFWPFLERNLKLVEEGCDPSAYFIDVFSAMPPHDYYDRAGRFHPKTETAEWWGRAFDRTREVLGGPTISEAGTDALVGHLDAAQADHLEIQPAGGDMTLGIDHEQWDRVPWFDMGWHGKFVLFAGGLGGRYQNARPSELHGYGSDDYLSLTVLGGRTPMADGPFSRRAVMTYWLLQPLCAELERQEMLAHAFDGNNVRRQRVTWSDGAVTVNRGAADWVVDGARLPEYGFVARAGALRADIRRRDGQISALAAGPGWLFADARPPDRYHPQSSAIVPTVTGFEATGPRAFRLTMRWRVERAARPVYGLFVHLCGPAAMLPGAPANADILFQAGSDWRRELAATVGDHTITIDGTLPAELRPGELTVKFGLWNPDGGARLALRAPGWDDARYDGGRITVAGQGDATRLAWRAGSPDGANPRDNLERRLVDFGPVATNSAFRLEHTGDTWRLLLLPGSQPGQVVLRLNQLGAAGRRVRAIERLALDGTTGPAVTFQQVGEEVRFVSEADALGVRVSF